MSARRMAIKTVFGEHAAKLNISSTKSMTGHSARRRGGRGSDRRHPGRARQTSIPPTINYEFPDPACDLNYTPNVAVRRTIRYALSNTFGFGGHNASSLFKKYTGE